MNPITLKVNGEERRVLVEARTQLAEILRDHLHLTGTHLGCEQGVCGACTVLVDGKPMRACILYAGSCDGAEVRTIEGFRDDPVMADLRRAFSRHHALQCGFCTPGMLVTARDMVRRLDSSDSERIRRELSGNLCRCTGYVGIVAAIADVLERRSRESIPDGRASSDSRTPGARPREGFAPFAPGSERTGVPPDEPAAARSEVVARDDWTVVRRSFVLPSPADRVWSLFEDTGRVCGCVPGVALERIAGEKFAGGVTLRFGPIHTTLAGEGSRVSDAAARTGAIEGRARDAVGRSDVRVELRYALREAPEERPATTVDLDLAFRVQGVLAQFNRQDVVENFVELILVDFIANCGRTLAGERLDGAARPAGALGLLARFVRLKWSRWRSRDV